MSTQDCVKPELTPEQFERKYVHPAKKYDKRLECTNLDEYNQLQSTLAKRGRKPKLRADIAVRRSSKQLKAMTDQKSPSELFSDALAAKQYALAWQIRMDTENRAYGRPYQAVNPDAGVRHESDDVSRIAVAIKNLQIVQAPAQPSLTKAGRKQPETIEAAAKPGGSG
jgi:hypothetical protein